MGDSRLLEACAHKKWSQVSSLLELTFDLDTSSHASMSNLLDCVDEFGATALHHALLGNVPLPCFSLLDASVITCKSEADIVAYYALATNGGCTALHLAASHSSVPSVVESLLERCPNAAQQQDSTGGRPVDRALRRLNKEEKGRQLDKGKGKAKAAAILGARAVAAVLVKHEKKKSGGGGSSRPSAAGRTTTTSDVQRFFRTLPARLWKSFYEEGREAGRRRTKRMATDNTRTPEGHDVEWPVFVQVQV